jgi:GH15 family glucan-1,4-alpha-glucosidase
VVGSPAEGGYQPIEDYGVIGNLRTAALVGLDGSIDWCCLPEFDSPSLFAAILDPVKGGRFRIAPAGRYRSEQQYLEGTNVLRTIFETEGGRLTVTDFMPLRGSITGSGTPPTTPQIHRVVECDEGEVNVEVNWSPRFDYARGQPRIEAVSGGFRQRARQLRAVVRSKVLDAANLLIPIVGFLPFDHPRVRGTIDRTLEVLTHDGVVYRYLADDGLPGGEGAFLLTTFWMVDALALSGRVDEATEIFEGMAGHANHLGLYAEQIDPRSDLFLGNYPQAFSHIGFINSALYLARAEGRRAPAPAPVGSREHGEETGRETGAKA